jgi:hypothetical protein
VIAETTLDKHTREVYDARLKRVLKSPTACVYVVRKFQWWIGLMFIVILTDWISLNNSFVYCDNGASSYRSHRFECFK